MDEAEKARLEALRSLDILDTPPSESFDRITRMASQIFGLPIAAVSLTDADRQWFKSRVGVDHWQIPREKAPCSEVSEFAGMVIIRDFQESACYRDSLLGQSGIRFYAGAPLVTREGHGLGALCVLGTEPREVTEQEIASLQDLAAMVMSQIELQHAYGRIDPASGLPNRNQFFDDLEDLGRDEAGTKRYAVVIDLVGGADLADVLRVVGPSFIDDLVASSSRATREVLGRKRHLYQIGATQYAYLADAGGDEDVASAARVVRDALVSDARLNGPSFATVPVFGIAPFVSGETAPRDILRRAHNAAQDARDAGVGVGLYSLSLDDAHRRRFTLLRDMPAALAAEDQLYLLFQPRVDLASGRCIGAEALLRWNHPLYGLVSPGEFIPLVEKTSLARDLTAFVVREGVRQAADWRARGLDLLLSLNILAANLDEEDFAERLTSTLAARGVPGAAIEIELTEGAIIANGNIALEQLDRIHGAGIQMAIDDFGTGYSSLSYLERIPAQVLKIDQSFMTQLETEPRSRTLVSAMISLAHELGYRVVAEGVETEAVCTWLADKGCDEAQGYLMARPLPPADFLAWFERQALETTSVEYRRSA